MGDVAMKAILVCLPKMAGKRRVGATSSWESGILDMEDLPGLSWGGREGRCLNYKYNMKNKTQNNMM